MGEKMKRNMVTFFIVTAFVFGLQSCNFQPTSSTPAATTFTPEINPLKVVYLKDQNLWTWTEATGPTALTTSGDVVRASPVSDDGSLVAYVRQIQPFQVEIWVINLDGSEDTRVVGIDEFVAMDPSQFSDGNGIGPYQMDWRSGTHILYFNTYALGASERPHPYDSLYSVDIDEPKLTTIFPAGSGGNFYLSPDGYQAAIVTPTHISLVNVDGSNLRTHVLTYPEVITYSEYSYYPHPIWTRDSKALMVTIPPHDPQPVPVAPTNIWYVPADGSTAVPVGSIPAIPFFWPDNAISPDLTHVAYLKSIGSVTEYQYEVHVATIDGSNDTICFSGRKLTFLGWMPNSDTFLFAEGVSALEQNLYLGTNTGGCILLSNNEPPIGNITFVDNIQYLYAVHNLQTTDLYYSTIGSTENILIDTGSGWIGYYDFVNTQNH